MEFVDYIRSASLVLAFLLVVVWDRKVWMGADMIGTAGFGLALILYPRGVLDFQVEGTLDTLHLQLGQMMGVTLLCSTAIWFLTHETRDGTIPITLMMSRVFSCGVLLTSMVYTQFLTNRGKRNISWTEQFTYFSMLGCGLWMLGNLVHLFRSSDFSTYPQHNIRLHTHLRVDAWLIITMALIYFAFPDFIISMTAPDAKPDAIHLHLARCFGIQGFGSAIISVQAPGFLHEHDKRKQFLERILTCVALFGVMGFQMVWWGAFTRYILLGCLIGSLPIFVNALIGYFAGGTVIYKFKSN